MIFPRGWGFKRPNVALVASNAPNATLGALDAPNATLGRSGQDQKRKTLLPIWAPST